MTKHTWFGEIVLGGLDIGWIAPGVYGKKRSGALFHVYRKLPADLDLPPMTIFAPSLNSAGEFLLGKRVETSFVYLSPNLEFYEQRAVDFLVAHEISHAVLGHGDAAETHAENEIAADALAAEWGFTQSERGICHEKLLQLWKEN